MSRLAPLSEEPVNEEEYNKKMMKQRKMSMVLRRSQQKWKNWVKTHFSVFSVFLNKRPDLKILLSVLACPLFPISVPSTSNNSKNNPSNNLSSSALLQETVSTSAQYIIHHYKAATGIKSLPKTPITSLFATGSVTMTMMDDPSSSATAAGSAEKGCFVMWEMVPDMWLIEIVVSGNKVLAGSDGSVAWRYTPWLGSHAAKGGVRPLRRALQGLDPMAIAEVFSQAQYVGEKEIMGTDCFVLKLSADQPDLADRSDSTAEMIKHITFGYFSQKNGLLVYLEDSYLTRIQYPGSYPLYWETTMGSKIKDYRMVEGMMIAHSGQTSVVITRFGDNMKTGPTILRMEETWLIDDIAFNVPGLSMDSFIPPRELQKSVLDDGDNHQYSPTDQLDH
ncbi:hypothetical protein Droror1_Dr00021623 [Drosera rotundifolia]